MMVAIKGIKMPSHCLDCPFYKVTYTQNIAASNYAQGFCSITNHGMLIDLYQALERSNDCPLVEVNADGKIVNGN